jgi:hypothetical protein
MNTLCKISIAIGVYARLEGRQSEKSTPVRLGEGESETVRQWECKRERERGRG